MNNRIRSIKAFTLIEMMVGVTILAIISLSLYATFTAGIKLNTRSRQVLKVNLEAIGVMEKMAHELENAASYDFSGSYPGKKDFVAGHASIEFLLATDTGLKAIRYFLQPLDYGSVRSTAIGETMQKNTRVVTRTVNETPLMALVREERDFTDYLQNGFKGALPQTLTRSVPDGGLKFYYAGFIDLSTTKDKEEEVNTAFSQGKKGRYTGLPHVFGKEKASKKKDPQISWLESWSKQALPQGVRIELTLAPAGSTKGNFSFTRDVLIPTGDLDLE